MKLLRRTFLQLAAGAVAPLSMVRTAGDQTYPARPVQLLVGFAAGGPLDTSARLIAQWLSERLRQQFIVVNQPGAGSNLAAETVVRAPPDGYTLLEVSASNAWNATLSDNLKSTFYRPTSPLSAVSHPATPSQ